MRLSIMKADLDLEVEGVWRTYGEGLVPPGEPLAEFKIARIGTPQYRAFVDKVQRKHAFAIRAGDEHAEEIVTDITNQAIARFVVIDWRGLHDDDGNEIPYSPERAYEFLSDPEMHDFRNWVFAIAGNAHNYRAASAREALGNSSTSSTGTSSGDDTPAPSEPGQNAGE